MNSKIKQIVISAVAVSFMVGCSKKSDDGGNANYVPPAPTTCIVGQMPPAGYLCMNGQLVPSAVGGIPLATLTFESTYMNGNLQINAQGPINTVGYPGQNNIYGYNGPVNLSGSMQASNTICINGIAPAGGYVLQGTANISNGILSNVVLSGIGPATLTFQNPVLIMYSDFTRVGISGYVLMNGQVCGSVSTY